MSEHIDTPKSKEYSIIFDYLRVFAMLGVLAVHLSQQFPLPTIIKSIAARGAYCVQVFYVISAYLGCSYFFRAKATTIGYYKKRALRILPTYYAAIVAAMLYIELAAGGYHPDIFHLGWVRYFLGFNTILPSANFWEWNNAFGFWTMTNFIFFYAVIPFVIKLINTFNKSVVLFVACFIVSMMSRVYLPSFLAEYHFSDPGLFVTWSPLGQMQHFALGVMAFFAVRENKKSFACIILIGMAVLPINLCSAALLFSILTCLFILAVRDSDVKIKGIPLRCLQFVSKYSFHVYLTHGLALLIAGKLAWHYFSASHIAFFISKLGMFVVCTIILCVFLELVQRVSNRLCSQ